MAHGTLIPFIQITDHVSKACFEILGSSVVSVATVGTRTGKVLSRISAVLFVLGARDIDRLFPDGTVKQFHEDITGDNPIWMVSFSFSWRIEKLGESLLGNIGFLQVRDGLVRAGGKVISITKKRREISSS